MLTSGPVDWRNLLVNFVSRCYIFIPRPLGKDISTSRILPLVIPLGRDHVVVRRRLLGHFGEASAPGLVQEDQDDGDGDYNKEDADADADDGAHAHVALGFLTLCKLSNTPVINHAGVYVEYFVVVDLTSKSSGSSVSIGLGCSSN